MCYRRAVPRARPAPLLMAALALSGTGGVGCGGEPMAEALQADPGAPFKVWIFVAPDPEGPWQGAARPLAAGVSSLGLHVEEGRIALTGLPMAEPSALDELFPRLRAWGWLGAEGLTMEGAASPASWTPRTWELDDPGTVAAIDSQGFEGGFWYFSPEGRGGDPAKAAGSHPIRSTPPPLERLSAPGLADPAPVRFGGRLLLFATEHPDAVVLAAGEPLSVVQRFSAVSVPFATVVTRPPVEQLWLVAQAALNGRRQPVRTMSLDGQNWTPWTPMLDLGERRSCTSPVLGKLAEGWMLACVEEPGP